MIQELTTSSGFGTSIERRHAVIAVNLIPYCLLLISVYLCFGHTVDDAYITYRYARNVLAGYGPVFNIGDRVEGFSSPLHLMLSTLLMAIAPGVDIYFKGKLLGLVFAICVIAAIPRSARLCGLSRRSALAAQILVAININFAMAAVNGLETSLYTFLVIVAATQFLFERKTNAVGWKSCGSAILLFFALLARPDATMLFAAFLLVHIVWTSKNHALLIGSARWAMAFIIPTVFLTLARLAYYGFPLPNTYYAKSVGLEFGITHGFFYLWRAIMPSHDYHSLKLVLREFGGPTAWSGIIFWALAAFGLWRTRERIGSQICAVIIGTFTLFVLASGGDWMAGWRFMVPTLPFFAILQVNALRTAADVVAHSRLKRQSLLPAASARRLSGVRTVVYVAAALFWSICLLRAPHETWAEAGFSTRGERLMMSDAPDNGPFEVMAGNYIRDHLRGCKHIAYSEMGYASFVNMNTEFLDTYGLTNRALAHTPRKYKGESGFEDPNWRSPTSPYYRVVRQTRPDAIIHVVPFSNDQFTGLVLGDYRPYAALTISHPAKLGERELLIYLAPSVYDSPNAVARGGNR